MTLEFESLSLKNFGPYRKIDALSLSVQPESPIVVFHGENTMGKTRLFRALRWCLYGATEAGRSPAESVRGLSEYMNRPARADGETDMEVSIKFNANGRKYHLTRTAVFDGDQTPRVTADLRIDSSVVQPVSIEAEIGRLLHPQISEFFLFDGELLQQFYDRLNSDRERGLLRGSIESVLGIPALQLARDDIDVMRQDAMVRQSKAMRDKDVADNAKRKLKELKSKQESLEKDRREIGESLAKAERDLRETQERIAAVDDLKADAREMETLEVQIKDGDAEEAKLRDEMADLLARGWLAPASARLSIALETVKKRNDASANSQKELQAARSRAEFLRKQIAGGKCPTCEQELPPPSAETLEQLKDAEFLLEALAAGVGDGPDLPLERRIRELIDTQTVGIYIDRYGRLNKVLSDQYDRRRRLGTIKDRLKDNDAVEIRRMGHEQDQLELAITGYRTRLGKFSVEERKIAAEQSKLASSLRKLGNGSPALAAEAYFFDYAWHLVAYTIERYKERTREEVESTATSMFLNLIRDSAGYKGISISPDYKVDLVGHGGPKMATSEGGRQLIALSLIGALKRAAVRGGPVVLDSPLARLDLEHRENVLNNWIPDLGSQAILLVQSGELTIEQAQAIMGNRVGQAYRIFRPNNNPEEASIERTQ